MSDSGNIRDLIDETVRLLAVGEGDIKHRLLVAYTQKLQYVRPEDLPSDLSPILVSIAKRLFKKATYKGQSTVEAALYRMHRSTAAKIAADVVEIHHAMSRRPSC